MPSQMSYWTILGYCLKQGCKRCRLRCAEIREASRDVYERQLTYFHAEQMVRAPQPMPFTFGLGQDHLLTPMMSALNLNISNSFTSISIIHWKTILELDAPNIHSSCLLLDLTFSIWWNTEKIPNGRPNCLYLSVEAGHFDILGWLPEVAQYYEYFNSYYLKKNSKELFWKFEYIWLKNLYRSN